MAARHEKAGCQPNRPHSAHSLRMPHPLQPSFRFRTEVNKAQQPAYLCSSSLFFCCIPTKELGDDIPPDLEMAQATTSNGSSLFMALTLICVMVVVAQGNDGGKAAADSRLWPVGDGAGWSVGVLGWPNYKPFKAGDVLCKCPSILC